MNDNKIFESFIDQWQLDCLKNISIDNVIFGYHNKELKVLLQRPPNIQKWMLSGGYIKKTESITKAAIRIAKERTGLNHLYLRQFQAFGNPDRTKDSEFSFEKMKKDFGNKADDLKWFFDYFVTIGYYTLVKFNKVKPRNMYDEEFQWWNISNLPPMTYDHKDIINEALQALRIHIYHFPIGYELMSKKFTMPELQTLYETILNKKLDRRNFSKKIIGTGFVKKLNERKKIGPHKSPNLYVFIKRQYNKALKEGIALVI